MAPLLDVRGLKVDIPLATGTLHAVRDIDFTVQRGETLCIVGESGCGKSLASLAIMNLLPRNALRAAERLDFAGIDLLTHSERDYSRLRGNRMAMIFQEPMTSLNPAYTIGDQLTEALLTHQPVTSAKARERALYLLDRVGITAAASRLGQYPHQLSGGLRQRVMIAMALMCGPELIIADEPTTALDVTIQAQILHLLSELQREFGMALILITHDLGVVARIAHKVVVMYAGQVVETGTTEELFRAPQHPYTLGLMECIPVPGKTARGGRLGSIPGVVPSLIGDLAGCAFRGRCPYATGLCGTDPELQEMAGGRACRCHYPPEERRVTAELEPAK